MNKTFSKALLSAAVVSLIAGTATVKANDGAEAPKKPAKKAKHTCKGQCGKKAEGAGDAAHGDDKAKAE